VKKKIKVLVIDDSAVMRQLLTELLSSDDELEVVGAAPDPYVAREKIKLLEPDVLTLDVEMPRMDGLVFLRNLMRLRPMPVVMCSSLTQQGADVTLDALSLGAIDFVSKPKVDTAHGLRESAEELITKVKNAAGARVRPLVDPVPITVQGKQEAGSAVAARRLVKLGDMQTTDQIIAIGASTGGTEAIKEVLMGLPADSPGVVITQHIPKAFSGPFAKRMNDSCDLSVCEARDGQPILAGHAYIAPGDQHLLAIRDGAHYRCKLSDGAAVNRHRPSVDVLFRSVAQNVARNAIGVMLTGMGRDGAEGMKEMREAGAINFVQDERTSVVWGMPGTAWELGAAEAMVPLQGIAAKIVAALESRSLAWPALARS
jgi:two-component system, chemotaxis family, protein-glutamate methylesterase/glutaminase